MGRVFRLTMVWAVTIALTASAAAWSQCPEIQSIASALAPHPANHQDHAAAAAMHSHEHMHHQHGAVDKNHPATDHDCMKCCALCMASGAVLPTAAQTAGSAVSSVVFPSDPENWFGNSIAIDPGIPKRIA